MMRRNWWPFLKGILFMQLFLLAVIAGLTVDLNAQYIKTWRKVQPDAILIPFSHLHIDQQQAELLMQENNLLLSSNAKVNPFRFIDLRPETIMESHIQALAYSMPEEEQKPVQENTKTNETSEKSIKEQDGVDPALFKGCSVYFYCTHSAESYIPTGGKARTDGKRGLINKVASTMDQDLQAKGISSHFINTIHDFPDYNSSYANSRETIKKIVDSDSDILAIFDVHRDSIPGTGKAATVEIDGKKSAEILIVVGTNERKPHPNWKKNYQFAQHLYEKSQKMYPGLIRGVRTKAGTYNQEYHSRALLLEFGSDYNTLEEACYAAQLFDQVLLQVLKEDIQH